MIAQHLSNSIEHYTPADVVEAAREVLGEIDLDPASCEEAQKIVRAVRWIGLPDDGLAAHSTWTGRVFLNPPGGTLIARRKQKTDPKPVTPPEDIAAKGKWGTDSRAVAWWRALAEAHLDGDVPEAIFIGFSIDLLQSAQGEGEVDPLSFSICVPRKRLCFGGDQPTHGNVIVYLGPNGEKFRQVFSRFGSVKL
jgi:hypothetical protein